VQTGVADDKGSRDVQLTIPAKPGYLVLARLALSAVCRLTPLAPEEVADLKLAVTEAASDYVAEEGDENAVVEFSFRLLEGRLELELAGSATDQPAVEQELSRAIIDATVDACEFAPGRTLLVKRLVVPEARAAQ
jgi:serine/threonine-protein kinase RsbW